MELHNLDRVESCQNIYIGYVDPKKKLKYELYSILSDLERNDDCQFDFDADQNLIIKSKQLKEDIKSSLAKLEDLSKINYGTFVKELKVNPNIQWILFPMSQDEKFTVYDLGLDNDKIKQINFSNMDYSTNLNNFDLIISFEDYVLYYEKKVVASFQDSRSIMQVGDCGSTFYQYENDIIVHNGGDVSSIVYIKIDDKFFINLQ